MHHPRSRPSGVHLCPGPGSQACCTWPRPPPAPAPPRRFPRRAAAEARRLHAAIFSGPWALGGGYLAEEPSPSLCHNLNCVPEQCASPRCHQGQPHLEGSEAGPGPRPQGGAGHRPEGNRTRAVQGLPLRALGQGPACLAQRSWAGQRAVGRGGGHPADLLLAPLGPGHQALPTPLGHLRGAQRPQEEDPREHSSCAGGRDQEQQQWRLPCGGLAMPVQRCGRALGVEETPGGAGLRPHRWAVRAPPWGSSLSLPLASRASAKALRMGRGKHRAAGAVLATVPECSPGAGCAGLCHRPCPCSPDWSSPWKLPEGLADWPLACPRAWGACWDIAVRGNGTSWLWRKDVTLNIRQIHCHCRTLNVR